MVIHTLGPLLVVLGIAWELSFESRSFIVEDRESNLQRERLLGEINARLAMPEKHTAIASAFGSFHETTGRNLDVPWFILDEEPSILGPCCGPNSTSLNGMPRNTETA